MLTQNPTNQGSQFSSFLQIIWKTIRKFKTEGPRELVLPENDFKACSAVNFPNKHPDFGGLETNQRHMKFKLKFFSYALLYMSSIKYKNCFRHLRGTSPKCYKFKKSVNAKKLFTILILQFFEIYIS